MTEQLWGIGGVVIGIVATGGVGWLNDRAKHKREADQVASTANRLLCEEFLADIESEIKIIEQYEERHGVFPIDRGETESPAKARKHLTGIELKCHSSVHRDALKLVEALEPWAFAGKGEAVLWSSRSQFIATYRKKV